MPERSRKKVESIRRVCNTPADFIVQFNFDFCRERYNELNTSELALKSNMIKLSDLKFAYENDTPVDFIRAWLVNLSIYSGLDADGQKIKEIARELYSEIFMLNLAEITLLFSRIKKGYYGEFYGRFDGMKIIIAAREYRSQRGMILAKLPEHEQKELI